MNSSRKFIAAAGLLLIIIGAGWEVWRWEMKTAPPAAAPALPPIETPLPIGRENPPAPEMKTQEEKPAAPAFPPKKTPLPKPHPRPVKKSVPKTPIPASAAPTAPPPSVPVPSLPPPPANPTEWQGKDTSVTHAGQVVIRSDRQWNQFWSEHHPHEASPDVDFTQNMVVGVFAGERPADQFSIQIVSIQTVSGSLMIYYREVLPPTGTFAMGVSVYPYHLKVIPRTTLPVKFKLLAPLQQ